MNLATAFSDSAQNNLDKEALYWGEDEFSYRQFLALTHWVAGRLAGDYRVQPGDRVAIWLKNCPQFVPALFGILQAGAVVVPINNFLKPNEVTYLLSDSNATVVITDGTMAEHLPALSAALPQLKFLQVEEYPAQAELPSELPACERTEQDLAVLIYTSGTTGRPKGAMLSHGNLLHNVNSCRQILQAVKEDRFVVLLPMFHSFMMTVGIFLPLLVGGSIVLIRSVNPPKNIVLEILQRRATILPAVPQFFRTFTHAGVPPNLPLRLCISGAAPLPGEILREFTEKFSLPLLEGYGLSEASPVVSFNPIQGPWKPGSIGLPVPDVEMSVQNDQGEPLGDGETGEICVRGGNVMLGYWNRPEETEKTFRGQWLLTGDVGHRDSDGFYYITDRKKDMLLVNGINVYPREIEEVLYQFPGVKEAAVIGQADARKGEQAIAFVALNEGVALDEKAILGFVREKLADYKVPRRVIALPALPRNATGKIVKTALREMKM